MALKFSNKYKTYHSETDAYKFIFVPDLSRFQRKLFLKKKQAIEFHMFMISPHIT